MSAAAELDEDDLIELSLLRDFETDELIRAGFLGRDEQRSSPLDQELVVKHDELCLCVTAGPSYPAASVIWEVHNYGFSRDAITELRAQLRLIVEDAETTNNISRWNNRGAECAFGVFEPVMVVFKLVEETAKHLQAWRAKKAPPTPQSPFPFTTTPSSLMTTSDTAFQLLRKTPQEICTAVPSAYRILHVEEVLRTDLVSAFQRREEKMRTELSRESLSALRHHVPPQLQHSKRKEDFIDHLLRPRVTFHGTQRQRVPSIVRHGFLKPGTKNPSTGQVHSARCGSTYGQGLYSSPNADFSLSYTDDTCHATKPNEFFGVKLIVCATLMGRCAQICRKDDWRDQTKSYPGSDSHVANRGLEYIVFDSAQIIPVYVIHIDWGQDNAGHFQALPTDPTQYAPTTKKTHPRLLEDVRWPGEIDRQKAAIHARASKYFPYGYGPATGGRFVVEDVAEPDDDEEEYGDYQAFRSEEVQDKSNIGFWSWVKAGEEEDTARQREDLGDAIGEYVDLRIGQSGTTKGAYGSGPSWDAIPLPEDLSLMYKDRETNEPEDEEEGFYLGQLMNQSVA